MRLFIVVMAIVLFLTGCSGGDGTGGSPDASGGEPTLNDFIPGIPAFDEEKAEQQGLQMERDAQEKIAACMAEQGFEYVPYVQGQSQSGFSGPESQEEFVAQYGFGIATMLLDNRRMGEMDEAAIEAEMAKDPNNAIVEAMTDAERDAYYAALYGEQPDIGFEDLAEESPGVTVASLEPTGCQNSAYEEVFNQGAEQEFYEQFGPLMEDLYGGLDSDPRIVELESKWSSCMAEKGYDFADHNDAEVFLLRRLEEVGAITDLEIDPDGMGFGFGGGEIEPGGPVEAAVNEIASEEIAIAKDSSACSADLEEIRQQVREEAEQRFIEEHLAELEQFEKDHS